MKKSIFVIPVMAALLVAGILGSAPAQSGVPTAVITAPPNGATINGNQVEISVNFNTTASQPVSKVQVYLDGKQITERTLSTPQTAGSCSFRWDTTRTPNGKHRLDIPIFSGSDYLAMASCVVMVNNTKPDRAAPVVVITNPKEGQVVSGITPIIVQAEDDSGHEPFVSIYVDKSLKSMSNRGPYIYEWDTTGHENGPHTIDVSAMDNNDNKANAKFVRVIIRNPVKQAPLSVQSVSADAPVAETPAARPVEVASVPAQTASAATPAKPAAKVQESARTAPAKPATEKFEVASAPAAKITLPAAGVPVSVPAPRVEAPVAPPTPDGSVSRQAASPVLMAKVTPEDIARQSVKSDSNLAAPAAPAAAPKPVALNTPDSTSSRPSAALVVMAKLMPEEVSGSVAKGSSNLAAPAVPVAKPATDGAASKLTASPVLAEKASVQSTAQTASIKGDSSLAAPAVPVAKPATDGTVSNIAASPVLAEKSSVQSAAQTVAKRDTTLAAPAVPVAKPATDGAASKFTASPVLAEKASVQSTAQTASIKGDSNLAAPAAPAAAPKPVALNTPDSTSSKPSAAPVVMAKLMPEDISGAVAKGSNNLAAPAVPVAKPATDGTASNIAASPVLASKAAALAVASTTIKGDSNLAAPAAPITKPAADGTISNIATSPVLAKKSSVQSAAQMVAKRDTTLAAPAIPVAKPATDGAASKPIGKPVLVAKAFPKESAVMVAKSDAKLSLPIAPSVAPKPVKKTAAASKPASLPAGAPAPAVKNTPVSKKAAVSTPVEKKPAVKTSAKPATAAPAGKAAKEQKPAEKSKMIGIRPFFEGEGKVYWNEEYKCVRAVSKKHDVRFQIGSPQAIVNARPVKLDQPSVIDDGCALVPETFIIDTLNMQINSK